MSKLPSTMFALMIGLGLSGVAVAQETAPAVAAQTDQTSAPANHQVVKPGDHECLQHTGSLIPAKKGECLPVTGRSYSGKELRRTGEPDNARALQMLDPSISVGH